MIAINLPPESAEQLIYNRLRSASIPDPLAKFVTAQSGHETDGWTSDVWYRDNNGFGYGWNGSSYTYYNSIEASVDELINYLHRRVDRGDFPPLNAITDKDQYAQLLKDAGYYGDTETNYSNGISRWLNNNLKFTVVSTGMIIFVLAGLWFLWGNKSR